MDKNAIKKYAVWARRELIEKVALRAGLYGITEKDHGNPNAETFNGHLLSQAERRQRKALIQRIEAKGYRQVIEEVAYTWFNRFVAIRFMEVNGYLPSFVRVFSDENGAFKPQIVTEAIHLQLPGLDMAKVYEMKNENDNEGLFKYLFIVQCNALNEILPGMFQKIEDYTELLLPDYLLREGSVIEQMVTTIPEDDWKDQVQIIGWLYQYYNTEPKDKVFADLKKNIKISKETIPAATQLFTPDWIVHYMVENSLGRLWVEGHPSAAEKFLPAHNEDGSVRVEAGKWNYYLEEAEQEPDVQAQLAEIRNQYASLKPEEILVIDPCAGSGHILCVLFDVLVDIYKDYGYSEREAAASIVKNNLWGLDIDDRAAQLAYFAVMMKARKYDRRFFARSEKVQPHVFAIQETNMLGGSYKYVMGDFLLSKEHQDTLNYLMDAFIDAKEYGSILQIEERDYAGLKEAWTYSASQTTDNFNLSMWYTAVAPYVPHLIDQAIALSQKYHVVVTNPPYMGSSGMEEKLSAFVKVNYPDTKSDMSTVCMERCLAMCCNHGIIAMINIPVWMFLSSYENLRYTILKKYTYINLVHPGRGIFGSDFGTTSFVITKQHISGYIGTYRRLFDKQGDVETNDVREQALLSNKGIYITQQDRFLKIPGAPVAYWASDKAVESFEKKTLKEFISPKQGTSTGDDETFVRFWFEIIRNSLSIDQPSLSIALDSGFRYFPLDKGGEYRKWYGNNEKVIRMDRKAYERLLLLGNHLPSRELYFREGITWSKITASKSSFRYDMEGFVFSSVGMKGFPTRKDRFYILGFLNSIVAEYFLGLLSPGMSTVSGDLEKLPIIISESKLSNINGKSEEAYHFAKEDWDSFETSWDFQVHPLIQLSRGLWEGTTIEANLAGLYDSVPQSSCPLETCFLLWQGICNQRFAQLKANEEALNRIFIDIYGLQDELTPEVDDKDVTVRRADLSRDIRSLISYAVGCMFGRYSLDVPGLVLAGHPYESRFAHDPQGYSFGEPTTLHGDYISMTENGKDYQPCSFMPDKDDILPITDDEYFHDDIVNRFIDFISVVYGGDTLDANLSFIAKALGGGNADPKKVIRSYFLNDFYKDHLKVYQKRPIYWLFDAGKKNSFKCLVYMHRYRPDTIARIRTEYVHEMQGRYRTAIAGVENQLSDASTAERVKLTKLLSGLQAQAEELHTYEAEIHHLADQMIAIDLDDGVKVNYAKFEKVLAPIK